MIDTYWGHQLVSAAAYDDFLTNCDVQNNEFVTGDDNLAFKGRKAIENRRRLMTCNQAIDILFAEAGSLNPYGMN